MNVLLIGGGGREHAMAWKLKQNPEIKTLFCTPGNGGISDIADCRPLNMQNHSEVAEFVRQHDIRFTLVGPEVPLVEGIVDYFEAQGLPIFGPRKKGAQLEGSKVFSKQFMERYKIPTADFREFDKPAAAIAYLNGLSERPVVVKADGLAAGKGSIVCPDLQAARQAVESLMTERIFQEAGARVVIETFMTGEEVSLFVITDGKDYRLLRPAQDFKRALDNDGGKNTGGMGSYSPPPFFSEALLTQAVREIVEPTLQGLMVEKIDYRGVLYVGLMLTPDGPRVIEYNCRFGDPETQVVLPLLDCDLLEMAMAVQQRKLGDYRLRLKESAAACVVLASGGYPEAYQTGKEIVGLDKVSAETLIFHAGTKKANDGSILTSGGRVLAVTAIAADLTKARDQAYADVGRIAFDNMHYRTDIASRAVAKSG